MGTNALIGMPQILILGPESSGKTTLVYGETCDETEPTQGYNREEKNFLDKNPLGKKVGVWDISGKEVLKPLWSSYYKNIAFAGVIFVIDPNNKEILDSAVRDLHFLTNEEELRDCAFLVLFNKKNSNGECRSAKELEIVAKRHEIHTNTKIYFVEFDFKGYSQKAEESFEWLYKNI